jgi:Flp pilus assembly protein TadD
MRDLRSALKKRRLEKRCLAVGAFRLLGLAVLVLQLSACASAIDPISARQEHVAEDPVAMMRIGEAAEASQDWTGADTFYRRASELDPGLASARLAHARMTARQGDLDGALAELREAHRLHADDVAIATALGRMLARAKRPAEALTVFDDGLRIAPGAEDLLVGKGVALDLLRRHAEAQQVYEASLKVDPDNAAARKNLDLSRRMTQQTHR